MGTAEDNPERTGGPPAITKLADLAPQEWLKKGYGNRLVARCYRMMRADETVLKKHAALLDVPDARVVFFHGQPDYYYAGDVRVVLDRTGIANIEVRNHGRAQCPPDSYMLVLAPFHDGNSASQALARGHVDQAAGLVSAFMGHNAVYTPVFENLVSLRREETAANTPSIRNPWCCRAPDFGPGSLQAIASAGRAIEGLAGGKRTRTKRSLRWFVDAIQSDGADAFIKLWTATEMIAIPAMGNIDLLCRILGDVYAVHPDAARSQYRLGKLYGTRNAIVHAGKHPDLPYPVVAYMEAVYTDVLLQTIGEPPLRRAAEALAPERPEIAEAIDGL
ncbi:MAG TPA: hypothetical protein VH475_08645 [Tepidisphaeraceae bacterium]|jgi:hypothetical protein